MRNLLSTAAAAALLLGGGLAISSVPAASHAQIGIGISVNFAPPALPVYAQPPLPGPGYLFTPGYWAWDPTAVDYYWVPGTWVQPPSVGLLWTPGYWGWNNGVYAFNGGYWGPQVGFYGGIDYGFGYGGVGYGGGYWQNGQLFYNRSVNNFGSVRVTNVYNKTVISNHMTASFNGPGGSRAKPTAAEMAAARERHTPATSAQTRQIAEARALPANHASVNHGKPAVAATARPGMMKGPGAVAAKSAPAFHRPASAPAARVAGAPATAAHAAAPAARTTAKARPTPMARPQAATHAARRAPAARERSSTSASERSPMERSPMERSSMSASQRSPTEHSSMGASQRSPIERSSMGAAARPAAQRAARPAAPAHAAARPDDKRPQ